MALIPTFNEIEKKNLKLILSPLNKVRLMWV